MRLLLACVLCFGCQEGVLYGSAPVGSSPDTPGTPDPGAPGSPPPGGPMPSVDGGLDERRQPEHGTHHAQLHMDGSDRRIRPHVRLLDAKLLLRCRVLALSLARRVRRRGVVRLLPERDPAHRSHVERPRCGERAHPLHRGTGRLLQPGDGRFCGPLHQLHLIVGGSRSRSSDSATDNESLTGTGPATIEVEGWEGARAPYELVLTVG